MDLNKFTERSKEILNSAQVLAMMQNHQLLYPVHLLSGIIDDDDTASLLLAPAGLDLKSIKLSIEKELKKIPAVTGNSGGISASKEFIVTIEEAKKISKQKSDEYGLWPWSSGSNYWGSNENYPQRFRTFNRKYVTYYWSCNRSCNLCTFCI